MAEQDDKDVWHIPDDEYADWLLGLTPERERLITMARKGEISISVLKDMADKAPAATGLERTDQPMPEDGINQDWLLRLISLTEDMRDLDQY